MAEIKRCSKCKFIGKEAYPGSHIWCQHPKAVGLSLPNRKLEIHPDCPIETFTIVRHVEGEYDRNLRKFLDV
jgi:hypothetical protein